jgi:hypothetical protein
MEPMYLPAMIVSNAPQNLLTVNLPQPWSAVTGKSGIMTQE